MRECCTSGDKAHYRRVDHGTLGLRTAARRHGGMELWRSAVGVASKEVWSSGALEARYTCVGMEFASRVLELWRYAAGMQT